MKRRDFIKKSFTSLISIPYVNLLSSCNKDSLPFSGQIIGESFKYGHLLRDHKLKSPANLKTGNTYSCIIVGGGCSGIASGWKLQQEGINDFLILEKDSQLGGTAKSGKNGISEYPWGAHYIETPTQQAKYLYPLYEDLGIILGYQDNGWPIVNSEYIVKDPEVLLHTNNGWDHSRFPYSIASIHDKNTYKAFQNKIYSYYLSKGNDGKPAFTLPISACSTDKRFTSLDQITMKDYLASEELKSPLLHWYIDITCRDNFGLCIDKISAWVAINYFATNLTQFDPKDYKKHPVHTLTWAEGNNYLVKGMSRLFKRENIQLNALVSSVENINNYVIVTIYDIISQQFVTHKAKSVIFALPKFLLNHICPEAKDRAIHQSMFQYAPWLVANLQVKYPPNKNTLAWDNIYYKPLKSIENWSLGYVISNHQDKRLLNRSIQPMNLTFYAPLIQSDTKSERNNLLHKDWDYWAHRIIKDLQIMHPNIHQLIDKLDIYKWGHAMIQPQPNFIWGKSRQEMKKPIKRIFMAHCDVEGLPIFEQAVYSGFRASEEVLAYLGKTFTRLI